MAIVQSGNSRFCSCQRRKKTQQKFRANARKKKHKNTPKKQQKHPKKHPQNTKKTSKKHPKNTQKTRCCNARIRLRDNFISFAFGLSNDERMSWKILWRIVLFLLYHINLIRENFGKRDRGDRIPGFRYSLRPCVTWEELESLYQELEFVTRISYFSILFEVFSWKNTQARALAVPIRRKQWLRPNESHTAHPRFIC